MYDGGFARPNTFILSEDLEGIRARLKVGSAPEQVVDVPLYCNRRRVDAPFGAIHARRMDETTWLLESATLSKALPRLELALRGVPPHVAAVLGSL